MRNFDYTRPATLAEAIAQLSAAGGTAQPLAGGTDLIDHVRTGRLRPDVLVDVKKIPELNVLQVSAEGFRVGAAVPCYRVYGDEVIQHECEALVDACRIIGGIQIQSRASIGGNLCNSGPAADATPALIVLRARCVIAGAVGTREVAAEEFCTGPGRNVLKPGELLQELRLPRPGPHSGSHYRRFIPRNEMDIAVVGVGAAVTLNPSGEKFVSARIALGAVAPMPLLATEAGELLAGQPVNAVSLRRAAVAACGIVAPIDDMRGTAEFRRHVTGVLVERVLEEAVRRARSSSSAH